MKVINGDMTISIIYSKARKHLKKPSPKCYQELYNNLSRKEINIIISQDYPKNCHYTNILSSIKSEIEEMDVDYILLGGVHK